VPELDIYSFLLLLPISLAGSVGILMVLHYMLEKWRTPKVESALKDYVFTEFTPPVKKNEKKEVTYGPELEGSGDEY
jgi:hypothetical protein